LCPCSAGIGPVEMDRKCIKDALEKHLERSTSTSRGAVKERERLAAGKLPAALGKAGKVSDVGKSLGR
jgi:casein kinase II subunit beta